MRNVFVNAVLRRRSDILVLSGDSGLGVFDDIKDSDQFLNMGIAEQNMASFGAGVALTGRRVMLYNIIPFLLYRCYEQVRNDICYQNLPIILAGFGAGLTYAPQGMTHYAIEDIGIAQTLPNLMVISPADPVEAKLAAYAAIESNTPVYVRMSKSGEPVLHKDENFNIRDPQILLEGKEIVLIFHGSIGSEVMEAGRQLGATVVSVPVLQPLRFPKLNALIRTAKMAVSVEEHYWNSGLGMSIRRRVDGSNFLAIGIPYEDMVHEVGDKQQLREKFGLTAERIVDRVKACF